jgi:hypothetical protein
LASCHWKPATPWAHHDAHHVLAGGLILITNIKRSNGETTSSAHYGVAENVDSLRRSPKRLSGG